MFDDLDQRVDRRADVSWGRPIVAGDGGLVTASLPLPPWWPSSMYFLALSQAPPPVLHGNRHEQAGDDGAHQQAAQRLRGRGPGPR